MGYKTLITIDLLSANEESRKVLVETLEKKEWVRVKTLMNSYTYTFSHNDEITLRLAHCLIKQDLIEAIEIVKIPKIECAFQISKDVVFFETINYLHEDIFESVK